MSAAITPPVGTTGLYRLLEPFEGALVTGTTYTCMAVRSLSELINAGLDPYEEYYLPNEIERVVYEEHVLLDTSIVSLRSSALHWVFVPNAYIHSYPSQNGVKYTAVVLGISLGSIPDHMELAAVKLSIQDIVRDTIGVHSDVQVVVVSETVLLSEADHTAATAARQAAISSSLTDRARIVQMSAVNLALRNQVNVLESYIAARLD